MIYLKELWQECEEYKSVFKENEDISNGTQINRVH